MLRRFLLTTWFALLAAAAAAPLRPAAAAGPDDFIRNLGNQAIEVIRSATSPDQKSAYFHRALHEDIDLRSISRFVLGPTGTVRANPSGSNSKVFWKLISCASTDSALPNTTARV
jgi:ABC-type transporter MlaC component